MSTSPPLFCSFEAMLSDGSRLAERLEVIEDTTELRIDHLNAFRFEARNEQVEGSSKVILQVVTVGAVRRPSPHCSLPSPLHPSCRHFQPPDRKLR
jgi:hypothetical protein